MGRHGAGRTQRTKALACLAFCAPLAYTSAVLAQGEAEGPLLRLGISTGFQINSNRNLDASEPGSTSELNARLDFLTRYATPIQFLELSANVGVRTVSGAEADNLPGSGFDPDLRLSYGRQSRDARIAFDAFFVERDVSATELQFINDSASFVLLDTTGTQLRFGFDTELELGRRSPFGVTLSAGFTGVRFNDTTDTDLTDTDRFRIGARLRFDLDPITEAIVDARFRTFEDLDDTEGRQDTYRLETSLRRNLRNGDISLGTNVTDTEDGTRYTVRVGRSLETDVWRASATLGLTREISGDVVTIGGFDLAHELPNGSLTAGFDASVRSGSDDEEQEVLSFDLGYATQLTALTSFDARFAFTDRNATGTGDDDDGQFATLSLGLQRQLSPDWSVDMGLEHRIRDTDDDGRVNDTVLRVNLRRNLLGRR